MNAIHDKLVALVGEHVTHWRDDLITHDRNALDSNPGVPFLHWARAHGTDLSFLFPSEHEVFPPEGETVPYLFGMGNRQHLSEVPKEHAQYWAAQGGVKVHYYDGESLRLVSMAEAVDIAVAHAQKVQREWKRKPVYT